MPETFDFAVSGINHNHIFGQVDAMLAAGCRLTTFHAPEDDLAAAFAKVYPEARRVTDEAEILNDPAVRLVVGAGIPADRAGVALRAMRAGKDAMVDKPGCTTEAQLAELRRVQKETGRIFSICYSEHVLQPSTVAAARLVAEGAIGRVVSTIGLGPHRIGLHRAPTGSGTPTAAARSSPTSPRTSSRSSSPSPAPPTPASSPPSRPTSPTPTAPAGATTATPPSLPRARRKPPPASSASTG